MSHHPSVSAKIRLVYLGTPAFALPALQALAHDARFDTLAVITQPDRPAGRGHKLTPPPVKVLAEQLGLSVFQTESLRKDAALQEHLRALQPDFLVTVAFGQILPQAVLDIPGRGTVNAHASLLPELRGANPIQQALLQGKTQTGITTMLTELGVDTGPMLLQHVIDIGPDETLGELTTRLAEATGPLLADTLAGMVAGTVCPEPQAHNQATHAPKCDKADAILNWQEAADALHRKIRAFNPAPGAVGFLNGERVKILRASLWSADSLHSEDFLKAGQAGDILDMIDTGIRVQTGQGLLVIRTLQPAGKREMAARDWATHQFRDTLQDPHRPLGCFDPVGLPTHPVHQPID